MYSKFGTQYVKFMLYLVNVTCNIQNKCFLFNNFIQHNTRILLIYINWKLLRIHFYLQDTMKRFNSHIFLKCFKRVFKHKY